MVPEHVARCLTREAEAGNYVMFREDSRPDLPWLGHFNVALRRWVLVTPTANSIALTVEQLFEFGFTELMLVRPNGLESP